MCTFKVTHSHARKVNGIGGVATLHNIVHDLDAVEVKVSVAEQNVEQEELTQRVAQVQELDEKVQADEIGAAHLGLAARRRAAHVGAGRARTTTTRRVGEAQLLYVAVALLRYAALAAPPRVRVLIDRLDHVEHDLVAVVELLRRLVGARRRHQVGYVQARLGRERAPHQTRYVEEERLKQQNERHPLVVLEYARLSVGLVFRQVLVHGRVERVRYPAYLFIIFGLKL